MKTCTVSEAKGKLGELADAAIKGKPTVIVRSGKLVVLQAYELPDHPTNLTRSSRPAKTARTGP